MGNHPDQMEGGAMEAIASNQAYRAGLRMISISISISTSISISISISISLSGGSCFSAGRVSASLLN